MKLCWDESWKRNRNPEWKEQSDMDGIAQCQQFCVIFSFAQHLQSRGWDELQCPLQFLQQLRWTLLFFATSPAAEMNFTVLSNFPSRWDVLWCPFLFSQVPIQFLLNSCSIGSCAFAVQRLEWTLLSFSVPPVAEMNFIVLCSYSSSWDELSFRSQGLKRTSTSFAVPSVVEMDWTVIFSSPPMFEMNCPLQLH